MSPISTTPRGAPGSSRGGWDAGTVYFQDDIVVYGGLEYQSLLPINKGNRPDVSPDAWEPGPDPWGGEPGSVSVMSFGADRLGILDSTGAFNAALAAVPGGTVTAPAGTFIVGDITPTTDGQQIVGKGMNATVLKAKVGATAAIQFVGRFNLGIADLRLDGSVNASDGLLLSGSATNASQGCTMRRIRFHNCANGYHVATAAIDQADKNTLYDCLWDGCTTSLNIAANNGQEQVLINPNIASSLNKAIDISAGTLTIVGGQVQTVLGAGTAIDVTGANVGWISLSDLITEGTVVDIHYGNQVIQGTYLKHCVLSGSSFCVDPGATSGQLLVSIASKFNTGPVGRATSGDFVFIDICNTFAFGSAWVPSTNYPRRTRFTVAADNPFGLIVDSFGSKFTAFAGGVALELDGPFKNGLAAQEATAATAGTNGAPPAQVKGYLLAQDHTGTTIKIPYYAA